MREDLLWDISRELGRTGSDQIRSVRQLRSAYPNISAAYPKLGLAELEKLLSGLRAGEMPPEKPKGKSGRPKLALLSDEEIRQRRSNGETLESIAKTAGISRARIGQICAAPIAGITDG